MDGAKALGLTAHCACPSTYSAQRLTWSQVACFLRCCSIKFWWSYRSHKTSVIPVCLPMCSSVDFHTAHGHDWDVISKLDLVSKDVVLGKPQLFAHTKGFERVFVAQLSTH